MAFAQETKPKMKNMTPMMPIDTPVCQGVRLATLIVCCRVFPMRSGYVSCPGIICGRAA